MKDPYQHVYLSPHYDDAALSCGGAIHKYVEDGNSVLVVTVCAAPPPPENPLSLFAQELHAHWGIPEDVVAARQVEDQLALETLGVDHVRLNFTDCIYRGYPQQNEWFYTSNAELFGQIHSADMSVADEISQALLETIITGDRTIVYAPLTVGNHIDHQLVQAAAWQLKQKNWSIAFYEDYPYVDPEVAPHGIASAQNLDVALAKLEWASLEPRVIRLSEDNLQAKIKSITAYASQVPFIFGGQVEMENQVRKYADHVGGGRPAERIWLPT